MWVRRHGEAERDREQSERGKEREKERRGEREIEREQPRAKTDLADPCRRRVHSQLRVDACAPDDPSERVQASCEACDEACGQA